MDYNTAYTVVSLSRGLLLHYITSEKKREILTGFSERKKAKERERKKIILSYCIDRSAAYLMTSLLYGFSLPLTSVLNVPGSRRGTRGCRSRR